MEGQGSGNGEPAAFNLDNNYQPEAIRNNGTGIKDFVIRGSVVLCRE
jgi:hypothetical protein